MTVTSSSRSTTDLAGPPARALAGALVFLGCYLAVAPVRGAVASTSAPLPDDPAAELRAYAVDNPLALTLTAGLQLVSVLGLLAFVLASTSSTERRPRLAGGFAVAAMAVSSALSLTVAASADGLAAETVATIHRGSFLAGGVVHVACLGVFVALIRSRYASRALRVFGVVAAVVSVLSLLSLAIYFANAFILFGRLLCMVWTVLAGVALIRRRVDHPAPDHP